MKTLTIKKSTKKVGKKSLKEVRRELKNYNDRTRRANKKFEALSPEDKRVTIARDVLAQLAIGRLKATCSIWLEDPELGDLDDDGDPTVSFLISGKDAVKHQDLELQKVLRSKKECNGCALGGLFMCAVERANKIKVSDLLGFESATESYNDGDEYDEEPFDLGVDNEDAFGYLSRFFPREQLEVIEAAFELSHGAIVNHEAAAFAIDVRDPSDRMKLIMQNIIVNEGTFVPEQRPVARTVWDTPGFKG